MPVGGLPRPKRYGGGYPLVATLTDSLNSARGSAYDVSVDSNVWPESHAAARCLAAAWEQNARLALQGDPTRVTDFLARWEAIFGVRPAAEDTAAARRGRLAAHFRGLGGPTATTITDACAALLGDLFVGVEYTTLADATAHWPATGEPTKWTSTAAHVVVRVEQPARVYDADFYRRMGQLVQMLDGLMPAWVTFDWAIVSAVNGFYLDQPNLDLETFDV